MQKVMKRLIPVALAVIMALTCLAGCKKTDKDTEIILTTPFEENEVFRIENESCFLPEVMVYMRTAQDKYEGLFGPEIWDKDLGDITLADQLKGTVLARLAQIKVLQLLAADYGLTLSPQETALAEKAASAYMDTLSQNEIADMGIDKETVANMYGQYALADRVYREITKDVNPEISDDEARTIKVKHILIKTYVTDLSGNRVPYSSSDKSKAKRRIENIAQKLEEGEDFDDLAGRYNEDKKSTYSFMKGSMPESFENAAFELDNDEVSGIVETEYGYHIIKCISTFDRDETDENKLKIVKERKNEVFNQVYSDYVLTLHSNLNEELWNSLDFTKDSSITTTDFFDIYSLVLGDEEAQDHSDGQ